MRSRSPSLSEGEVRTGDEEKANTTRYTKARDNMVDSYLSSFRPSQHYSASRDQNPYYGASRGSYKPTTERDRSRSPYRKPQPSNGVKRRHEEDPYLARGGSDPRTHRVHYEHNTSRYGLGYDSGSGSHTSNHPSARFSRHGGERPRDRERSRSPYKHPRPGKKLPTSRGKPTFTSYEQVDYRNIVIAGGEEAAKLRSGGRRLSEVGGESSEANLAPAREGNDPGVQAAHAQRPKAATPPADEPEPAPEPKLTEAEAIERRRLQREALKARLGFQPPSQQQAKEPGMSAPGTPMHDSSATTPHKDSRMSELKSHQLLLTDVWKASKSVTTAIKGNAASRSPTPSATFRVDNDEDLANHHQGGSDELDTEGVSAADYDPNADAGKDLPNHRHQSVSNRRISAHMDADIDMFADEDDDIFAENDEAREAASPVKKQARVLDASMLDNWDDQDGHYRVIINELLDERYAVRQQIGKGTFAVVVRAEDAKTGKLVAIKIACNNATMFKAGQMEKGWVQKLNEQDEQDKKHIVRFLRDFNHKNHLCLVFENLSLDLREVLKKFGRNRGLNLAAIRAYAQQMFIALNHLKKCHILHADLKPDNILVNEGRNLLKICDLGTALNAADADLEPMPYLISRYYRAPEVILGIPFDYAIDMWSIGCTLFELYTGRILFTGDTGNQMLRHIQACRGKVPNRLLNKSALVELHFDLQTLVFESVEEHKITKRKTVRPIHFKKIEPGKDLRSRLLDSSKGLTLAEKQELDTFIDLLDKMLQIDPQRRPTPLDALKHPFFTPVAKPTHNGQAGRITPAMNNTGTR